MNIFFKKKNAKVFLSLIFTLIIGIILYIKTNQSLKDNILNNLNNGIANNTFNHNNIINLIVIMFLSLIGIGLPLCVFLYFYELISGSYLICLYYTNHGLSGIIYSLIYILLKKGMYILIIFYLISITIKYIKSAYEHHQQLPIIIFNYLKKTFLVFIITIIVELINYYVIPYILNIFLFLI